MESEKLCLQWNDFQNNVNTAFRNLREDNDFNDVTLVCEDGTQVEAHKVVLAASSPVFQNLLRMKKHSHPLIYMRGMKSHDLLAIVDFLYCGEANVFQEYLDSFLAVAEELQLKGLMGKTEDQIEVDQEALQKTVPVKDKNHKVKMPTVHAPKADSGASERSVAVKRDSSEDFSEIDAQINSMMKMSQNGRRRTHICKVCGKEGHSNDVRKHIESNHLEGLSFPCNLCEKTFRSRNAFAVHKHRNH